jgi:hypothetical protein
VKVYSSPQEQLAPVSTARVRSTQPGDGALAVGQGLLRAGVAGVDIATDLQEHANADAVFRAESELKTGYLQLDTQLRQRRGSNAVGVTTEAQRFLQEQGATLSMQMNDPQKKAFAASVQRLREHAASSFGDFEGTERRAAVIQSADASIAGSIALAAKNPADATQLQTSRGEIAQRIAVVAELSGWTPEQTAEAQRKAHASLGLQVGTARAYSDPKGVLTGLDTGDELYASLTPEQRHHLDETARAQVVRGYANTIAGIFEEKGTRAGNEALSAVNTSFSNPEVRSEIRAQVNERVNALRGQRRAEHADDFADLERRLANDTAGRESINKVADLYESGAMSVNEYATTLGQIEASGVRRAKGQAGAAALNQALASGIPLDPRNEKQREALSAAFGQETVGHPPGSLEWINTASAYASKTRMLPDQALGWMRGSLRSPDAEIAAKAAQFYGSIAAGAPDALSQLDEDSKAFAATVSGMLEAGTPPQLAIETARANQFDLKPAVREMRERDYKTQVKGSRGALESLVDRDFDPGLFSAQPDVTVPLQADFDAQAGRYFTKTGDIDLARKLAWKDLKGVYGPSEVNGVPQMIAFPPERFGVAPDQVRKDIGAFLSSNPQGDALPDDIILVPDALTLRLVGDAVSGRSVQPSYKLVNGKTGDLVTDANGAAKRYTVPSGEELGRSIKAAQDEAEQHARSAVNEAKLEREARLQESRDVMDQARAGTLPRRGGLD